MRTEIDATDLKILELLQVNGALSATEVADEVGLSQSPAWRRINRLETEGVIARRVAVLDKRKLGFDVTVLVQVKFGRRSPKAVARFEAAIRGMHEVQECHMLMGSMDFLLKVVTRDVESYERFLRAKLSSLPGVKEIESSLSLLEVKSSTALPLDGVGDRRA
jgi:Lrp/AsnC family transcriptional regulator